MTKDEALTLEALKYAASKGYGVAPFVAPFTIKRDEALAQDEQWTPERIAGMARLKEAQDKKLAQPEQEPVATMKMLHTYGDTTPQPLPWVGLTDEDCKGMSAGDKVVAMWADKTLKEKNT